jgi:hypothetical protein
LAIPKRGGHLRCAMGARERSASMEGRGWRRTATSAIFLPRCAARALSSSSWAATLSCSTRRGDRALLAIFARRRGLEGLESRRSCESSRPSIRIDGPKRASLSWCARGQPISGNAQGARCFA